MIARPKEKASVLTQCYGDLFGMSISVELSPDQKWNVRKSNGYYWLSRKGVAKLRLTGTALSRLFVLEDG